jgi:hypothetical protein
MFDPTGGPARESISARVQLDRDEQQRLAASGMLVVDDRRRRPLYFDGRFLAARDLTREQNYFLTREADLGRAGGAGVVHGLLVEPGDSPSSIRIAPGNGVTPAGELVVLAEPLTVRLTDVAEIQRLDAAFGLLQIPREPARNPTGLFIIALRPVEFTANPIASYPTAIDGPRGVEDGDIVEAVAVTLIPYADHGGGSELGLRRARVAREIFIERATRGLPAEALPLAMVALDRGVIQWLDPYLLRREVGAEHGQILGLGFAPRALREAHLLQYDGHLLEVLRQRQASNRGQRFAASEHFLTLPPGGRMPAAAINPSDFTQTYFPAEVDVELSIVPDDEVVALLDESLLFPPIDLALEGDELESTSVLVLIPVPRPRLRTLKTRLSSLQRQLLPAAPGLVARRKPLESLQILRLPRPPLPTVSPQDLANAAWREALASADLLWYVRRRNLPYRADLAGASLRIVGDEARSETQLLDRVRDTGLTTRFNRLRSGATAEGGAELVSLLSAEKFAASRILMDGAIRELEGAKAAPAPTPEAILPATGETAPGGPTPGETVPAEPAPAKLDRAIVLQVAERFGDPQLGEGIRRLESVNDDLKSNDRVIRTLAQSGAVPELDQLAREIKDSGELAAFASEVGDVAKRGDVATVNVLVNRKLAEIRR